MSEDFYTCPASEEPYPDLRLLCPFYTGREMTLRVKITQRDFTLNRSHEAFFYAISYHCCIAVLRE